MNRDAVTTLEAVVSLYGAVGCPVPALEATLDCVTKKAMDGDMQGGPGLVAGRCMVRQGFRPVTAAKASVPSARHEI